MTGAVSIAPDAVVALRDRLRCLRADLRRRLAKSETIEPDGTEIRLTLYAENGAAFAAPIAPGRAVALAGELIAAALPKLAR
jgi:hypothetical protein